MANIDEFLSSIRSSFTNLAINMAGLMFRNCLSLEEECSLLIESSYAANTSLHDQKSFNNKWNQLPKDILEKIAVKLSYSDCARIRAVCKSWNAILTSKDLRTTPEVPWLLLPQEQYGDCTAFYSSSDDKVYKFKFHENGWRCWKVCKDWLVMTDREAITDRKASMVLWNPISKEIIRLPPANTIPKFNKRMDLLLLEVFSIGSPAQLMVAAIFVRRQTHTFALCRPQDKGWTIFNGIDDTIFYQDVLFHKGMLYALVEKENGEEMISAIHTINVTDNCEVKLAFVVGNYTGYVGQNIETEYHPPNFWIEKKATKLPYLAESSTTGDLLLIWRVFDRLHISDFGNGYTTVLVYYRTSDFQVQVMNWNHSKDLPDCSTTLDSVGNEALFVGTNGAISVESEVYKNCIYFLPEAFAANIGDPQEEFIFNDLIPNIARESGVLYLEERRIKRCFPSPRAPKRCSIGSIGWFKPKRS